MTEPPPIVVDQELLEAAGDAIAEDRPMTKEQRGALKTQLRATLAWFRQHRPDAFALIASLVQDAAR